MKLFKSTKYRIELPTLAEVLAVWPHTKRLVEAAKAITVDNDGDGKPIEFEAGEAIELIEAASEFSKAIKALNPLRIDVPAI